MRTVIAIFTGHPGMGWEITTTLPGAPRIGDRIRLAVHLELTPGVDINQVHGVVSDLVWDLGHLWLAVEVTDADVVADGEELDERTTDELAAWLPDIEEVA